MAGLYDEKILGLRQQREFARKIREQASQGVEAGSMVSGHYVPNYGGMVANAMRQIMSGYEEGNAQNQEEDLTRQKYQDIAKSLGSMGITPPPNLLKQAGSPAVDPSLWSKAGAFLSGKEPPQSIPSQDYMVNVADPTKITPQQRKDQQFNLGIIDSDYAKMVHDAAIREHALKPTYWTQGGQVYGSSDEDPFKAISVMNDKGPQGNDIYNPTQQGAISGARANAKIYKGETPQGEPTFFRGSSVNNIPHINNKGWELHEDAQGNQAYVGPNGEIEEIN